jgi:hypothetical protein
VAEPFTFSESEETTIDALTATRRRLQELATGRSTTSQMLDALTQPGRRNHLPANRPLEFSFEIVIIVIEGSGRCI